MGEIMKLLLLTVTYNNSLQCMDFLRPLSKTDDFTKAVIVDNGSTDQEFEILKKGTSLLRKPERFVLIKGKNVGLTKAWNFVIRKFSNYDYYIIASCDVIFRADTLKIMKKAMAKKKRGNVVLSAVLYSLINAKKTNILQTAGTFFSKDNKIRFNILNALKITKSRNDFVIQKKDLEKNEEIKCNTTAFGCIFFHKDVLKRIGLFNENFFLFNEDSDFFLRLKKAEVDVILITKAKIWHPIHSISTNNENNIILYHRILSGVLFYRIYKKNAEIFYLVNYSTFVILKLLQSLVKLRFRKAKVIMAAYFEGLGRKLEPIPKI